MEFSYSSYVSKAGRQFTVQKKTKQNKKHTFPSFATSTEWYEVQLTDTSVRCHDLDLLLAPKLPYLSLKLISCWTPFVCTTGVLPQYRQKRVEFRGREKYTSYLLKEDFLLRLLKTGVYAVIFSSFVMWLLRAGRRGPFIISHKQTMCIFSFSFHGR